MLIWLYLIIWFVSGFLMNCFTMKALLDHSFCRLFKYLSGFIVLFTTMSNAAIEMPGIFSNGMVLQRSQSVPVWGFGGTAGAAVTVSFGGQTQQGTVRADGSWRVNLNAMSASATERTMTVKVGSETKTITGIVVGEVWLCSGQSNMDYRMRNMAGVIAEDNNNYEYAPVAEEIANELATIDDSLFRQFTVSVLVGESGPKQEITGHWMDTTHPKVTEFTATGYYFAKNLREKLNVPVGIIKSAASATRIQGWIPEEGYRTDAGLSAYYDSEIARYTNLNALNNSQLPAILYNHFIHPLAPFAMKGVIWYQGEANSKNANNPSDYKLYLQTMITAWRDVWGQGDFPFYYAQLANIGQPVETPQESATWATVQDQMRQALDLPNTGMAVNNDIGQANDVHPRNKIDVGKRLALWALKHDYGFNNIVHSGPLYSSNTLVGSTVNVTFTEVASGLMTGHKELHYDTVEVNEPVTGFQIRGSNGTWYWANAEIIAPNRVALSHPSVSVPVEIRYDWQGNTPGINLYNSAGLPTSAFAATVGGSTSENTYTVTFALGAGSRSGGGALSQTVNAGSAATAPVVTPPAGYTFTGWNRTFTNVTSNLTITAQYEESSTGSGTTITNGTGRYVRIDLPTSGTAKTKLYLEEVEIYVGGVNIAPSGTATQISDLTGSYIAGNAVDQGEGSFTASATGLIGNPWWEIDLGSNKNIEKIVITNITGNNASRLTGFTVSILDAGRNAVHVSSNLPNATVTTLSGEANPPETTHTVTFNLGSGSRSGGGALTQTVSAGTAATAPTVTAPSGYTFTGWSTSFTNVTSNLSVTAQYAAVTTSTNSLNNSYHMSESSGRYVRVSLVANSKPLRLAEVEVYANGENVALSKSATQSSDFSTIAKYDASVAVDLGKDRSTGTYTANQTNPWWEVDLGATYPIDKIIIYESTKSLANMKVEVLNASRAVVFTKSSIPDSERTSFLDTNLGNLWLLGDQMMLGSRDGDATSSPRSVLYDQLTLAGFNFSFTGHTNTNAEGLSGNNYTYHSAVDGATLTSLKNSVATYWNQGRLANNKPDTILLMVGSNDVVNGNIDNTSSQLKSLVDAIYALPNIGTPKVFLSTVPPNRVIEAQRTDTVIYNEVIQSVVNSYLAEGKDVAFIDPYTPLDTDFSSAMMSDHFYLNGNGNTVLGAAWAGAIEETLVLEGTDNEPSIFPGVKTVNKFNSDYRDYAVTVPGTGITFTVTPPKSGVVHSSGKKPWMWRNIFYSSNTGQSMVRDFTLVDEGYYVVNVYGSIPGHPNGNAKVKTVYDYLVNEFDFAPTFSASCMSRGAFMVFAFANEYPELIESIYMDNACADALAWPAGSTYAGHIEYAPGKRYSGPGSAASYQLYVDAYDEITSLEQGVEYLKSAGSPIHQLEPLAADGVPILSICGSSDHAVIYEENDARMQAAYTALGGDITVLVEDKGHSHGPKVDANEQFLFDFIRRHTFRTSNTQPSDKYTVTFNLGQGSRSGGGAITQLVNRGAAATAPTVTPPAGYTFTGGNASFTNVPLNLGVRAQ